MPATPSLPELFKVSKEHEFLAHRNLYQKHNLKILFGVLVRDSFTRLDFKHLGYKSISRKVASEFH